VKNDKDTYQVAKNEKVNVRFYGPTIAVVTGSTRSKGTTKAGKAFDRAYRYTDTWVQREGKWQCVASQDSLLGAP
jgi:ketosteroid isomerase-like protein